MLGNMERDRDAKNMYLGQRKIRSAGRTSGSVEVTLPVRLQSLQGVGSRLLLRDGVRPEIVLMPDLGAAQELFQELWLRLRAGLGEIADIGDFSLADFQVALFPPGHSHDRRPPLSYRDALVVLRDRRASEGGSEALGRLVSFLAVVAAERLGLQGGLALAFGDAVGYLATGVQVGLGTDFQRGMAHAAFFAGAQEEEGTDLLAAESPLGVREGLRRVFRQFLAWQEDPGSYASAWENWWRALAVEMGMGAALAETPAAREETRP